jgi:AraC-like DNA-binding protein
MSINDLKIKLVDFQTNPHLAHMPKMRTLVCESNSDANYSHNGKNRKGLRYCFFQYTISGVGEFHARGKTWELPAGTGFICDSHDPAYTYCMPENSKEAWEFLYIQMTGETTHLMVNDIVSAYGYVYQLKNIDPVMQKYFKWIQEGFDGVLTAGQSANEVNHLLASLIESTEEVEDVKHNSSIIQKALSLLSSQADNPWNATLLADGLNISREHLSRLFNKHLGKSPYKYILEFKIRRSCFSLKKSNDSIKEIAYYHGFKNPEVFSKSFKKVMGLSPNHYREQ